MDEFKQGTNVIDVVIPQEMLVRINTGIDWIDKAISADGGLIPSIVYMLSGVPGAGKSTLFRQIGDSLKGRDENVIYNSGEEHPFQIAMTSKRMNLKHGFTITTFRKVNELLTYANKLQKMTGKRVILMQDSLQSLDDGKYSAGTNGRTPSRCCKMLTDWAKKTGNIVMFICQVNKKGDFSGKNDILHDVDVQMELKIDKDPRSEFCGERIFRISKNRFGFVVEGIIYDMTNQGLKARCEVVNLEKERVKRKRKTK